MLHKVLVHAASYKNEMFGPSILHAHLHVYTHTCTCRRSMICYPPEELGQVSFVDLCTRTRMFIHMFMYVYRYMQVYISHYHFLLNKDSALPVILEDEVHLLHMYSQCSHMEGVFQSGSESLPAL